eukprot:gene6842-7377_t
MREKFASCHFRDFIILEELYRSRIGIVYKVQFKYDSKIYVLKERKIAELGQRKDILNEVKLLQQLRSQNIVQYEGWFRDDDRKALFIVLEYCNGGDLYHFLEKRKETGRSHRSRGGRGGSDVAGAGSITASTDRDRDGWKYLSEKEIWFIFYQICIGLKHLHENGIIHRDIKTLNVFLSFINDSHVFFKIGDLGVSRQVSENTFLLNTFYGTPLYLSPELIENKAYNEKTDIWSLGIILYELIMLQPPFIGNSMMELSQKVLAGEYEPIPSERYPAPSSLGRCVAWLLTKDYTKRPNVAQVIDYVAKKVDPSYHGETLLPSSMSRPTTASTSNKDREKALAVAAAIPAPKEEEKMKMIPLPSPRFDENDDIEEDSLDEASPVERGRRKPVLTSPPPVAKSKPQATPTPIPIAPPLPSPPDVKSEAVSKPAASRKYPKIPHVSAEDEQSAVVTVDIARIHAKHRREIVKYRKLLQMRDFILGGAGAVGEEGKGLDQRVEELLRLIQLYEYAMEKKTLPQAFAVRYQLPILPEKNALPQPELVIQASQRIVDDSLPVYLQQPPLPQKRQVIPPSPNQQANRVLRPKTASAAVARRGNGDDEDDVAKQKKEVILNALWAKDRPQQPNPINTNSPNAPARSFSAPSSPPPPRVIYENQQPRQYQHYLDQHHQHRQDLLVQQQQQHKEKKRSSSSAEVDKEMKEGLNAFNNMHRDEFQPVPPRQNPFQVNPTPTQPSNGGLGLVLPSMKNKPKQDKHSKFIEVHQDQSIPTPSPPPRQKVNNIKDVEEEERKLRPRPKTASSSAQVERKAERGVDNKSMVDLISDRRRLYNHNRMVSDITAYQEVLPKYHKAESHVNEILHQEKRKETGDQDIVEDTDDEAPERNDIISSTDDEGSPARRRVRERERPRTSSRQVAEDVKEKRNGKSERGRSKADAAPSRNKTRIDRVIRHQQQSDYNIITGAGI